MAVMKTLYYSFLYVLNRISLPLMDSIETSPKINRINTATLPRTIRPHIGDSSDSDSESDTAPLGDTFITRYIYSCMVANKQCCTVYSHG